MIYKILLSSVVMATVFAFGRYSVKPTIQVQTVTKEVQTQHETIVTVKSPDGTTKTIETVDTNTKTNEVIQQTAIKTSKINVSVLVGNDFSKSGIIPLYGISVNKELIGPITVGVFGLTNSTIGLSIGLNF